MEGSCCVAVLEAAPAPDAPCPPQPGLEQGASSRVRGMRKSLMGIPSAWSCCTLVVPWPEGQQGGKDEDGHGQGAEGMCFFLAD